LDECMAFERIIQQDPAGLEQLMKVYGLLVLRVIRQVIGRGRPDDVEECAGDVWLTVWQKAVQYDRSKASGKTWICVIARHKAVDYLRKSRSPANQAVSFDPERMNWYDAEMKDIPEILEEMENNRETSARLSRALSRMPDADRQLLLRRYFYLEEIRDLARSLGITRAAADNRLSRSRKILRKLYLEMDFDGSGS
jgi:RNA polymerase sigma-70 factor, ECF subfamily